MQRGRADARQLSRAVSPANNGTSPGRLIPPSWSRQGKRLLLPPAPWPPACLLCLHPLPVDLSALGDEMNVPLRRPSGDPKAIRLSLGKPLSDRAPADGDDLTSSGRPASSTHVMEERRSRRLRLQLKKSWERLTPAVKIRCGLKAVHPDVPIPLTNSNTQTNEVGVLVHDGD